MTSIVNTIAELVSQLDKDDIYKIKLTAEKTWSLKNTLEFENDLEDDEIFHICNVAIEKIIGVFDDEDKEQLDNLTDYTMMFLEEEYECYEKIEAGVIAWTGCDEDKSRWHFYKYNKNLNIEKDYGMKVWELIDNPFEDEDEDETEDEDEDEDTEDEDEDETEDEE
jgi:hypothetical protein